MLPNTNYSRYELLAGILVVRKVLPIPTDERLPLLDALGEYDFLERQWRREPSGRHTELLTAWHGWLHSGDARSSSKDGLHGEASLLAAASYRIMIALNPGRTADVHPEVQTLVMAEQAEPWR
jgi:hypothetical protein